LLAVLEENFEDVCTNRLSRWQMLRQFIQNFWKRWSREYLHTLQQRNKWTRSSPNSKIGGLVILREEHSSPLEWNLARKEEVYPGSDGIVRVVTLRTVKGVFKGAISRILPLPLDN